MWLEILNVLSRFDLFLIYNFINFKQKIAIFET